MAGGIKLKVCGTSAEVAVEASKIIANLVRVRSNAVIGLANRIDAGTDLRQTRGAAPQRGPSNSAG